MNIRSLSAILALVLIQIITGCISEHTDYYDMVQDEDAVIVAFDDPKGENTNIKCSDEIDNDGNGDVDCSDTACSQVAVCMPESQCEDGRDNDNDGLYDCEDFDCYYSAVCIDAGERTFEECSDESDNDDDGLTDCDESSCGGFNHCTENNEVSCQDGEDNDDDGEADCNDLGCAYFPHCLGFSESTEAFCLDEIDNDTNGYVDCNDPGCSVFSFCNENSEILCKDGIDNDEDGKTDCNDGACIVYEHCKKPVENTVGLCTDEIDNDLDGFRDCADSDCKILAVCSGEDTQDKCRDGKDNDGDGIVDCDDPDCSGIYICVVPQQDTTLILGFREEGVEDPYIELSQTKTSELSIIVGRDDNGIPEREVEDFYTTWVHDPGKKVPNTSTDCYEGNSCLEVTFGDAWEMVYMVFSRTEGDAGTDSYETENNSRGFVDISSWASSVLTFMVQTSSAMNLTLKLEYKNRTDAVILSLEDVGYDSKDTGWQEISVNFNAWATKAKMEHMSLPFSISKDPANPGPGGTIKIDDIRLQSL